MITAEMFRECTGRSPEHDDLDRVNCEQAGMLGHLHCGWCKHERPMYECSPCADEQLANALEKVSERGY
jgi:hypothetical protein